MRLIIFIDSINRLNSNFQSTNNPSNIFKLIKNNKSKIFLKRITLN